MHYKITVFQTQFPLVKWFTVHLLYYRELKSQQDNLRHHHGPFWAFTMDAHLSMACIYWCMVFGASGSNPTHWKNLVRKQDQQKLSRQFTKAVLERTGFTEQEWKDYWHQMVSFRNKYVVHRDQFRDQVPHFDQALAVAYAYDGWVRTLFPGIWDEPPFESQEEERRSNIRSYIVHLASMSTDGLKPNQ
jgi:hypothetical protein